MAARDNVLFYASVASGATAGTVVPLSLLAGVENVRQGYGSARLMSVRAFWVGSYSSNGTAIPIEIKNSNWVDSAGLIAQGWTADATLNRDSLGFLRGRGKELAPNTSWIINATLPSNTTGAGVIYAVIEIEYSDVPGYSTENAPGSPVFKTCSATGVTGAANTIINLGSFDNLLQNVNYMISEVSVQGANAAGNATFVVLQGFSNQRGLMRIIPAKHTGLADQIDGSVILTKQTYSLGLISSGAQSSASVIVGLELVASTN